MGTALIRRCDIFINMFEQKVAKVQQEINEFREMEKLYNITSDVVNKWTIENDVNVELNRSSIFVRITGIESDTSFKVNSLAQSLHDKFVELGMKEPSTYDNAEQTSFYWTFTYKDINTKKTAYRSVNLSYQVPDKGNVDLIWEIIKKNYTYEDRSLVLRKDKTPKVTYADF